MTKKPLAVPLIWREAAQWTFPIALGYFPAGIAFGVLLNVAGFPIWTALFISLVMYSGAAQYAIIPMLTAQMSPATIHFNIFIINLRHIFYATPIRAELPQSRLKKFYILYALTDETFSLLTTLDSNTRRRLCFPIALLNHVYWVSASLIGAALGDGLNRLIPNLDFAMICLFVILCFEQYLSRHSVKPLWIALGAWIFAHFLSEEYAFLLAVLLCLAALLLQCRLQKDKASGASS